MSNSIKGTQAFTLTMAWLLPAAVAGVVIVTVITYVRTEETHAASGSPLYGQAVKEAVEGLKNPAAKMNEARPPLQAGLSPDEYYWCEQCKAYHKRQPVQGQPAGTAPPPVAGSGPVAPATPGMPAAQPDATIPPLPAGLDPADYYWCANCKAYHKRQPAQGQPGSAAPPPVAGDNPAIPAAVQPAGVIPPLPAGLVAADYYWCANCKAYHKRQPDAAVPAASGTVPTPTPVVPPGSPIVPATPGHAPVVPVPVAPVNPATPVPPVPPATPAVPATPAATPATPTTPAAPVKPAAIPAAPGTSVKPDASATPSAPTVPVPPTAPATPAEPVSPVAPAAPVKP